MSGAVLFDRQILDAAFSEIDGLRRALPEKALALLAEEVVQRVARNLRANLMDDPKPESQEIDALCQALLAEDQHAATRLIESVQRRGCSYDALCLSYLAVAAKRLGEWWEDDQVSFADVTIAAGRIYAILRSLRLKRPLPVTDMRRHAVFAAVPGENHTLGIAIAADLARDRGWDIELFMGYPHDDLVGLLEQRQTPLIGLSASGRRSLPALIKLIVALRISNPGTRILVCGRIGTLNFNLVGVTGADAVAVDFDTAVDQMERLVCNGAPRMI